jgi:hypothetical protein
MWRGLRTCWTRSPQGRLPAYRLLATLSGNQALVDVTTSAHLAFADCLPFD